MDDAYARLEAELRARAPELLDLLRQVGGRDDGARYVDRGPLGRGGMGEVRRVEDRVLDRIVAMKRARPDLPPAAVARFLDEVRTTGRLQHPGIVPVYDAGRTTDGHPYFTMTEIRGRTLSDVVRAVHAASATTWEATTDGWSLRRLVGAVVQASLAVAYAHAAGVVHADLKPDNVMVGAHGEVQVLDWGLARAPGAPVDGRVVGTPAYMPPEQARGAAVDERADVYALGATLYEVLSGRPPYHGAAASVVARLLAGPPEPVDRRGAASGAAPTVGWGADDAPAGVDRAAEPPLPLPPELVEACERAMARAPEQRFPTAAAFAEALQAWLDGSRRRERGLAVVAAAAAKGPEAVALRGRAAALRAEAAQALARVPPWQPDDDKAAAWAKEDAAADLEARAADADLEAEQLLHGALTHAPDLAEAHAALARRYRAEHAAAEAGRADARRAEALLRVHLAALPPAHPERAGHAAYLRGDGALTLLTDPPGAAVTLCRHELRNRRLVPVEVRDLGRTPLRAVSMPMGSWSCTIAHPDRAPVRYPVWIGRGAHWDGVPPEGGDPAPIRLPRPDELGPDDVYVPAGWFSSGGDPASPNSLPGRRVWLDGFVVRRFPVTNAEYLAFLDALVAAGREDEALRCVPRERSGTAGERGAPIFGFDGRRFSLRADADGDVWAPDWPIVMVDWDAARTFAGWVAAVSGSPWSLPHELQWEKAARGVDGRWLPFGDHLDPSWARVRDSHSEGARLGSVHGFPVDESVYGVRGLVGNVMDWCADVHLPGGPPIVDGRAHPVLDDAEGRAGRVIRGGGFFSSSVTARSANRGMGVPNSRYFYLGFRLARPFPGVGPPAPR